MGVPILIPGGYCRRTASHTSGISRVPHHPNPPPPLHGEPRRPRPGRSAFRLPAARCGGPTARTAVSRTWGGRSFLGALRVASTLFTPFPRIPAHTETAGQTHPKHRAFSSQRTSQRNGERSEPLYLVELASLALLYTPCVGGGADPSSVPVVMCTPQVGTPAARGTRRGVRGGGAVDGSHRLRRWSYINAAARQQRRGGGVRLSSGAQRRRYGRTTRFRAPPTSKTETRTEREARRQHHHRSANESYVPYQ